MRSWEIQEGRFYLALIGGELVTVQVIGIRGVMEKRPGGGWSAANLFRTVAWYDVKIIGTGKCLTFKSARVFRARVASE